MNSEIFFFYFQLFLIEYQVHCWTNPLDFWQYFHTKSLINNGNATIILFKSMYNYFTFQFRLHENREQIEKTGHLHYLFAFVWHYISISFAYCNWLVLVFVCIRVIVLNFIQNRNDRYYVALNIKTGCRQKRRNTKVNINIFQRRNHISPAVNTRTNKIHISTLFFFVTFVTIQDYGAFEIISYKFSIIIIFLN